MSSFAHASVMVAETLEALAPHSGGFYADATVGGGGHSAAILDASAPDGRVLAVDRDPRAVEAARERLSPFGARALVVHGDYEQLPEILREHGHPRVDGLVADLGVSSPQLDDAERGFSFASEGPLDMRMDGSQGQTLAELLERVDERELADILYQYGEERRSRAVARSIIRARDAGELHTTLDLRRAIVRALGPKRGRIDPATRSFQGLRIALNRELEQLDALLAAVPALLEDDGVAVLISFHSLEDRMVKRAFRGDERLMPLTKRPLQAGEQEQADNPRARSAKLRAARRVTRTGQPAEDEEMSA
jgi:16S rRNA (cytosine1402-N4)-methyltransferase